MGTGRGGNGEGGSCHIRYKFVFVYFHSASDRGFLLLVCSFRVRYCIPMTAAAAMQNPVSLTL